MGFSRILKTLFVKQPEYAGQVTLPYDIESVYKTIPTLYGGLTGFCGTQIVNVSDSGGARLEYCDKNGMSAHYFLSPKGAKETTIRIVTEFPTGNAFIYFEDIVKKLKEKLEK